MGVKLARKLWAVLLSYAMKVMVATHRVVLSVRFLS
jgi:hypothetical protein